MVKIEITNANMPDRSWQYFADLSPAQAKEVMRDAGFTATHPGKADNWFRKGNYLADVQPVETLSAERLYFNLIGLE